MKRLLVGVLAVLVLLVVADRAGAAYAARAIGTQLQESTVLDSRPDVDITGFPFLTQALSGRYERIEVSATDVPVDDDLVLSVLDARLQGVRVPLSEVMSQSVEQVPVDRVTARALVPYDELSRSYGDQELSIEPDGDRLRITGELRIADRTLSAVALSRVEVDGGELLVSTEEVGLGEDDPEQGSTSELSEALELRVPVEGLPYELAVTSAQVRPDGVALRAEATDVVLQGAEQA